MAISKDDVKKLKLKEVNDLKLLLAQHENEIKQEELETYIEEVKDLAIKKGLEFSAIFKVIVKKPKITYPAVYRNPDKPSDTWSGMGAPSKWVKIWVIANSEDLTPLLINKSDARSDKIYLDEKQIKSIENFRKKNSGSAEKSDGSPAKPK